MYRHIKVKIIGTRPLVNKNRLPNQKLTLALEMASGYVLLG